MRAPQSLMAPTPDAELDRLGRTSLTLVFTVRVADRVCCYFPGYEIADERIGELVAAIEAT